MTKIVINGSNGRMGQALLACAPKYHDIQIVGRIDVGDDIEAVIRPANVVVDFSSPKVTPSLVRGCVSHAKAMVIGTTGHSPEVRSEISRWASVIPIVLSTNFSVGVNLLFRLVREAAEVLGPGFDLEIMEMHHRFKKDAPSGTAQTLCDILCQARCVSHGDSFVIHHGRQDPIGVRTREEIGIHSIRGGDVVGDHTVHFLGDGERLEFTHRASSRETFANGALRAAEWVVKKPAGLYSMAQVLGLEQ